MIDKVKAGEFCEKIEALIRSYENSPGATPLSESEKKDAFYNPIMVSVPAIKTMEFMCKTTCGKGQTYEQLKTLLLEHEATRNQATGTASSLKAANFAKSEVTRCFECQDYGHKAKDCQLKGTGLIKCYKYNQFSTHKAYECPNESVNKENLAGSVSSASNKRSFYNSNFRGRGQYQRRGLKRKYDTKFSYNAKRARPEGTEVRGRGGNRGRARGSYTLVRSKEGGIQNQAQP